MYVHTAYINNDSTVWFPIHSKIKFRVITIFNTKSNMEQRHVGAPAQIRYGTKDVKKNNITFQDRETNIWVREMTKVTDII